jgi:uncharacterized LabA/DUF88 family protein
VLASEGIRERFDRIYLASGDGIFTTEVAALAGDGVPVTVVARPESLSRSLRLAATSVVFFNPGPSDPACSKPVAA